MLDWIFEGIVGWVGSIVSQLMDASFDDFVDYYGASKDEKTGRYNLLSCSTFIICDGE